MSAVQKLFGLAFCLGLLVSCAEYKTREFVQVNAPTFLDWEVRGYVSAFSESSGASWDDHTFGVSVSVKYEGDNDLGELAAAELFDLSLREGPCALKESDQIRIGKTEQRARKTSASLSVDGEVLIPKDVDQICMRLRANFTPKDGSKSRVNTFELDFERRENSFYWIAMA